MVKKLDFCIKIVLGPLQITKKYYVQFYTSLIINRNLQKCLSQLEARVDCSSMHIDIHDMLLFTKKPTRAKSHQFSTWTGLRDNQAISMGLSGVQWCMSRSGMTLIVGRRNASFARSTPRPCLQQLCQMIISLMGGVRSAQFTFVTIATASLRVKSIN